MDEGGGEEDHGHEPLTVCPCGIYRKLLGILDEEGMPIEKDHVGDVGKAREENKEEPLFGTSHLIGPAGPNDAENDDERAESIPKGVGEAERGAEEEDEDDDGEDVGAVDHRYREAGRSVFKSSAEEGEDAREKGAGDETKESHRNIPVVISGADGVE